jgi:hypothetical protein
MTTKEEHIVFSIVDDMVNRLVENETYDTVWYSSEHSKRPKEPAKHRNDYRNHHPCMMPQVPIADMFGWYISHADVNCDVNTLRLSCSGFTIKIITIT